MAIISDKFPPQFNNATQYAIHLLNERYPGLEVQVMRDVGFDGVIMDFRFRGQPESSRMTIDNTFLATASGEAIANSIEYHIRKFHKITPSRVTVPDVKPKTGVDSWAEEWSKKNA